MVKLGARKVVVLDRDGEEHKEDDAEPVKTEQTSSERKLLTDKQKEVLEAGREKNRQRRLEKKNERESLRIKELILAELDRRKKESSEDSDSEDKDPPSSPPELKRHKKVYVEKTSKKHTLKKPKKKKPPPSPESSSESSSSESSDSSSDTEDASSRSPSPVKKRRKVNKQPQRRQTRYIPNHPPPAYSHTQDQHVPLYFR